MLNFTKIRKEIAKYDSERENLIKKSRDVLKLSKRVIYSVHRNNLAEAFSLVKQLKKEKSILDKIAKTNSALFYEGSYSEAMQEYAEAMCYFSYIKQGKLPSKTSLAVSNNDYLLGICDFTGELTRKAVNFGIKGDSKQIIKIKKLIDNIQGEFLKFNLRNSFLRKKSDSIKYNLLKIEDLLYRLKTKR